MTREEAERLRDRLAREHPDRETHSFLLSAEGEQWTVAKVALPPSAGTSVPGQPGGRQPLHGHDSTRMPGGVPNWTGPG